MIMIAVAVVAMIIVVRIMMVVQFGGVVVVADGVR